MKKQKWEGQIENVPMEFSISTGDHDPIETTPMADRWVVAGVGEEKGRIAKAGNAGR